MNCGIVRPTDIPVRKAHPMTERTFVMVKPDGVRRRLVGEITATFERAGLTLVALKMLRPSLELATNHYPETEKWLDAVGQKTLEGYQALGQNAKEVLGVDDPRDIGRLVKGWLVTFLTGGDVVAMVWEGNAAVKNVRRLCGSTMPVFADPGTIRGKYGIDSPDTANAEQRTVHNLVHASGELDEAEAEIALWFPELRGSGSI